MAIIAGPSFVLGLVLGVSRANAAAPPPHWTVIANADWPHNGGGPPSPAVVCDSAECCADHCLKDPGCAAVSWNWKKQDGSVGDHGCNFKCTDTGQNTTPGEQGVVVRKGQNFCSNNPPGPPAPPPPPPSVPIPEDWLGSMQQGSLFFYPYDIPHTDINTVYGNGAPLGNGFVGTKADAPSVFIGGVYSTMYEVGVEPPPPTWVGDPLWRANESARARIPATVSSIGLPVNASGFVFAGAALDAKRAIYIARHKTCGGKTVVERRMFAHRVHRGLLVTEIFISGKCGMPLAIPLRSFADNGSMNHSTDIDFTRQSAGSATDLVAELGSVKRPEHCNVCPNGVQGVCQGKPVQVAVVRSEIPRSISVPPNTAETSHLFIASYATDLESESASAAPPDPLGAAEVAYTTALADGAENLMLTHVNAWADLWDQSAIEVEGDELLARAVWSAAYPIVSSIRLDWGEHHGLAPGGLFSGASPAAPDGFGEGRINYLGHVFWDCEMWSWPALLPMHPDLAAAALKYRKRTIDSARTKAAYYGWGGTMFAWESAAAGGDMCPCGGKGTTREQPPRSENSMEIHINSDISFATSLVYRATGNKTWLAEVGAPLAHGVAEFWASRVTPCSTDVYGVDKSRYCVRGVMGPDESHAPVDDSPFTSAGAQFSLKWGMESSRIIGCQSGACAAGANWSDASDIRIIYDPKLQYHPQYVNFTVGTTVRQADVQMIYYPLQYKGPTMTPAATVNDIELYENHMSGPAMTWAIFAINLMALAEQTNNRSHFLHGEEEFKKSYQYLGGISGGSWHEGSCSQIPGAPCGSGTANFITGSGGFLQSVVSGYGGLRYSSNIVYGSQLELTPQLPSGGATRLFFKGLHYLGSTLSLDIAKTGGKVTALLTLRNMTAGAPSISLFDDTASSGGGTRLQIGSPVEVAVARKAVVRRTEKLVEPQPLRLSAHSDGQSRPDARSNGLRYIDEHPNASLGETGVAPAWNESMEVCSGKCEVDCKTYRPPVGACYSPPLLWPGDTQWGLFDTLDRCNATHLDRSFFSSVNGSCTKRTDGFSLPLHTCIGPFGKPRPWGKFSCSPML